LSIALCVGFTTCSVSAWEGDVHYGLTKWLAFKAGFSLHDAELIARGAEEPDQGKLYQAISAVFMSACFGRDRDRADLVRVYHFPSYGLVPGPPSSRIVDPGLTNNAATELVDKEIQTSLPNRPPDEALDALGRALHPLQDSWSHQGEPDSPFPWICSKDYAFGHPQNRGGWRKHDADLTFLHEGDTSQTAHFTYLKLTKFLETHPKMRSHPAEDWTTTLVNQVTEFAKASSKKGKRDWFNLQSDVPLSSYDAYPDFLSHIDLPDTTGNYQFVRGGGEIPYQSSVILWLVDSKPVAQKTAPDAKEFVDRFMNAWIVARDTERTMTMVNASDFSQPFIINRLYKREQSNSVTRSILDMWLVADHGRVNELGHGLDQEHTFNLDLQKLPRIKPETFRSAIFGSGALPYDMYAVKVEGGLSQTPDRAYAIAFQFQHAPQDAVVLLITHNRLQGWRVSQLMWWTL